MAINKGFIKDWGGNTLLPITRGELVLDSQGNIALASDLFLAGSFKDAQDRGLPGLVTAAERAMLSGGANGEGIADIYIKLGYINNGLKFNGNVVNFYNSNGASPINIVSDGTLNIGIASNTITLGLEELEEIEVSQILKSIIVDKYGRVTSVTGGLLTNEDIPKTLSEKIFSNCTTDVKEIANNELAVVNKYYVDKKFDAVNTIATGALTFKGPLATLDAALAVLQDISKQNCYYKVTGTYTINSSYLYSETETIKDTQVKPGDTLIIYPVNSTESKFVLIPAGDDITTITVKEENAASPVIDDQMGPITLQFSPIFNVESLGGTRTASISFPQVSVSQSGYLSNTDYAEFKAYSEGLKVEYISQVQSSQDGSYQIGNIIIGGKNNFVYGLNNISTLTLNDGTESAYNPILKFTETGVTDLEITYKGLNGILVRKNGNTLEFLADIKSEDEKYLTVTNGYKLAAQLGSIDESGEIIDGLMDFRTGYGYISSVAKVATKFEIIEESLKGATSTTEYRYGNQKLIDAITVTI